MFKDKQLHAKVNEVLNRLSQLEDDFEKLQDSTGIQEIKRLSRAVDRLNDTVVEHFEGTDDVITITKDDI